MSLISDYYYIQRRGRVEAEVDQQLENCKREEGEEWNDRKLISSSLIIQRKSPTRVSTPIYDKFPVTRRWQTLDDEISIFALPF